MIIEVPLTQGKVALINASDFELVRGYKWCAHRNGKNWYAMTNMRHADGRRSCLYMHRLILGLAYGNIQTDHRDGNGLNNTRDNLRACTIAENIRNSRVRSDNKSGLKGVSFSRLTHKWRAVIRFDGKWRHLGYFLSKEAAYAAYCKAATELHGEFANFGD